MGKNLRGWKVGSYDAEGRSNSTTSKSEAKTGNDLPTGKHGNGMQSMPSNAADSGRRNKG